MPATQRRPTPQSAGKRDHTVMESRRKQALVLLDGGANQSEVARQVGVSRQAVSKWVAARHEGGIKALASKGKPGRRAALTVSERKKVEMARLKGPVKNGYRNDLWTLRRVAAVISRVTGRKEPSVTRTWNLMREMRWSCQRPGKRAPAVAECRDKT